MRSLLMVGVLFFAVAGSAMAQDYPKGEVGGNYTYIRINPGGSNCHGGGGSSAWNLNHYFGVAGEFDGCKVTGLSVGSAHAFTYLFGPRVTYRTHGGLEPFAEALVLSPFALFRPITCLPTSLASSKITPESRPGS